MSSIAIGIDLGTTNSVVSVLRHGRVEIIANDFGNRTTPSIVAFDETERLIGDSAKKQLINNPTNTIYDVKRLMGRNFDDKDVQADKAIWPFQLIHNYNKPKYQVRCQNGQRIFSPEEISSMILRKLKEIAEDYLGVVVKDAVITVPAYFNDLQRKATKDAAEIAELNVLSIINEPTAAAIAYGFENKQDSKRNILIFDLGGGTFDVSILEVERLIFQVKATGGNTHLGGEDFDNRLVKHFLKEIELKHKLDLSLDKRAMAKLRRSCEEAKRILSQQIFAKIDIEHLFLGRDYKTTISRARFEEINQDLFQSAMDTVAQVLKDAKLDAKNIDEVVLVGGSTRIPKLQMIIKTFFNGKEPVKSINPDEAVAYGAAIQASRMQGNETMAIKELVLEDVTPLSLGLDANHPNNINENMAVIIKRNTKIPAKFTEQFVTAADYQSTVTIEVFQGESTNVVNNVQIGEFTLIGIPPAPKGEQKVDVTFEINNNGLLSVTAVIVSTGKAINMTIDTKGYLTSRQTIRMMQEARRLDAHEKAYKEMMQAKNQLEEYCLKVQSSLENDENIKKKVPASTSAEILQDCTSSLSWLSLNEPTLKAVFVQRMEKLQQKVKQHFPHEINDVD